MTVLLIDHYDSFTYNLLRLVGRGLKTCFGDGNKISVLRCSDPHLKNIETDLLVLSPGPMTPSESGFSKQVVERHLSHPDKKAVLGVCLGMQIVNEVFGGKTVRSKEPTHGRPVALERRLKTPLFEGLPNQFKVARYNSLACSVPKKSFLTSAVQVHGDEPMTIEHSSEKVVGLQFHPESFLSEHPDQLINNFLRHYASASYYGPAKHSD